MASKLNPEEKSRFLDFLDFIVKYKVDSSDKYKEAVRRYSKNKDVSIEDVILKSAEFISDTIIGFKSTQWPDFNQKKGFDIIYNYAPEEVKNILKSGDKKSILHFYSENQATSNIKHDELKVLDDHFKDRLDFHVSLVRKYLKKLLDSNIISEDVYNEEYEHDASKYSEPERTPYLYINWKYKMQREGIEYNPPQAILDMMNEATFHHISVNKHHADYWDPTLSIKNLNTDNRDAPPEKIVDATKMPLPYVASMCADWAAMSEEKSTSPYDWAKNNINIRWKFTPDQEKFIYETLDKIWDKEMSIKEKAVSSLRSNGIEVLSNGSIRKEDREKALAILANLSTKASVKWSDVIKGEYWLTEHGSEFADIDVGEAGHEGIALDHMIDAEEMINAIKEHNEENPDDKIDLQTIKENDVTGSELFFVVGIPNFIGEKVCGKEKWEDIKTDVRKAFCKYENAILAINTSFGVWKLDDKSISMIQDHIFDMLNLEEHDYTDGDIFIEEFSTNKDKNIPVKDFLNMKHSGEVWRTVAYCATTKPDEVLDNQNNEIEKDQKAFAKPEEVIDLMDSCSNGIGYFNHSLRNPSRYYKHVAAMCKAVDKALANIVTQYPYFVTMSYLDSEQSARDAHELDSSILINDGQRDILRKAEAFFEKKISEYQSSRACEFSKESYQAKAEKLPTIAGEVIPMIIDVDKKYVEYFNDYNNQKSTFNFLDYVTRQLGHEVKWDDDGSFLVYAPKNKKKEVEQEIEKYLPNLIAASYDNNFNSLAKKVNGKVYKAKILSTKACIFKNGHSEVRAEIIDEKAPYEICGCALIAEMIKNDTIKDIKKDDEVQVALSVSPRNIRIKNISKSDIFAVPAGDGVYLGDGSGDEKVFPENKELEVFETTAETRKQILDKIEQQYKEDKNVRKYSRKEMEENYKSLTIPQLKNILEEAKKHKQDSEKSEDITLESIFNEKSHEAAYAYYKCAATAFESAAESEDSKKLYNKSVKYSSLAEKHLKLAKNKKLAKEMFENLEKNEYSVDMHNDIISGDLTEVKSHPIDLKTAKSDYERCQCCGELECNCESEKDDTKDLEAEYNELIDRGQRLVNNSGTDVEVRSDGYKLLEKAKKLKAKIDKLKKNVSASISKERVHNQMEAEVLIKEAFEKCDEDKYDGTPFFTHSGEKLFDCAIHINGYTMSFPDGTTKTMTIAGFKDWLAGAAIFLTSIFSSFDANATPLDLNKYLDKATQEISKMSDKNPELAENIQINKTFKKIGKDSGSGTFNIKVGPYTLEGNYTGLGETFKNFHTKIGVDKELEEETSDSDSYLKMINKIDKNLKTAFNK